MWRCPWSQLAGTTNCTWPSRSSAPAVHPSAVLGNESEAPGPATRRSPSAARAASLESAAALPPPIGVPRSEKATSRARPPRHCAPRCSRSAKTALRSFSKRPRSTPRTPATLTRALTNDCSPGKTGAAASANARAPLAIAMRDVGKHGGTTRSPACRPDRARFEASAARLPFAKSASRSTVGQLQRLPGWVRRWSSNPSDSAAMGRSAAGRAPGRASRRRSPGAGRGRSARTPR
jgi:hypothetical protein